MVTYGDHVFRTFLEVLRDHFYRALRECRKTRVLRHGRLACQIGLNIFSYNFFRWRCILHTTNLRKVGGSVMLAVPPAFLDQLHLQAGATVGLAVDHGRLVVEPKPRPRYTLAELPLRTTRSRNRRKNANGSMHLP